MVIIYGHGTGKICVPLFVTDKTALFAVAVKNTVTGIDDDVFVVIAAGGGIDHNFHAVNAGGGFVAQSFFDDQFFFGYIDLEAEHHLLGSKNDLHGGFALKSDPIGADKTFDYGRSFPDRFIEFAINFNIARRIDPADICRHKCHRQQGSSQKKFLHGAQP